MKTTLSAKPHVSVLPPDKASNESNAVYEEFYKKMSFPAPPNFIMTQGHSPTVARGTWGMVKNVLVEGEIPRWQKEMVFVAISRDRKCRYCAAAHIACCRMLGVRNELLDELVRDVSMISDLKLRETILFAVKCSRDPQSLTEEDYDKLRNLGFTESEVVELIAMAAFAVYANILADATAMEADPMFDEM
jgi:uncharacterized peroxidase-related enzyme